MNMCRRVFDERLWLLLCSLQDRQLEDWVRTRGRSDGFYSSPERVRAIWGSVGVQDDAAELLDSARLSAE